MYLKIIMFIIGRQQFDGLARSKESVPEGGAPTVPVSPTTISKCRPMQQKWTMRNQFKSIKNQFLQFG